ncbi:MAG: serine/threonine-protein kinase, partial [Planctomycetota bacterium]
MEGTRLGRFEIESILGRGGMGAVYAARDTESGERVALKVLSGGLADDEQRFRRFEQEVAALSRVTHENVVSILGPLERDGDRVFFPMELLEGETLATRLRREGPQPVPAALGVIRALLEVLSVAHDAGVIHRDIKPSNIFLAGDRVVVTDFGLARMEDITRLTKTGQLMGTLSYMSPEQCEGEGIDHRTDLYSAGIILYEMLVGAPPFHRETPGAVLKGHLTETPSRLDAIRADLPGGLSDVVAKLLAKRPDDRFGTAREALSALSGVPDPSVTVTFHAGSAPAKPRRRGLLVAAVALLALAAAAVLARPFLAGNASPPYPGRGTRDDLMETIHRSIERADFAAFARCFDADLLDEHLPNPQAETFARRAKTVTDFQYRLSKSRSPGMVSFRSLTGRALPTVLGIRLKGPLGLVIPPSEDEYLVAGILANPASRVPLSPSEMRRVKKEVNPKVAEFFDDLETNLSELVRRRPGGGRLTPEDRARLLE